MNGQKKKKKQIRSVVDWFDIVVGGVHSPPGWDIAAALELGRVAECAGYGPTRERGIIDRLRADDAGQGRLIVVALFFWDPSVVAFFSPLPLGWGGGATYSRVVP